MSNRYMIYEENHESRYEDYGGSRVKYLESLADDLGIDKDFVFATADIYGEDEDFDGLVTTLEDLL